MKGWPETPLKDQPEWLRQYSRFIAVREFDGDWVLECRCCDSLWAVPLEAVPAAMPNFLLMLAQHGMQHAVNGEISPEDLARPWRV
jgi:hypothetical protein